MRGKLAKYSATDFASIFYKHYKRAKNNIPQAFVECSKRLPILRIRAEENIKQVFHPNGEIVKLTSC